MKIKTYVITLSKRFPSYHPRKGQPTEFGPKVYHLDKRHTIRGNYAFWKPRIDSINRGEAILSVREWIDKPYYSKQKELAVFGAGEVGIQKCDVKIATVLDSQCAAIKVNGIDCSIERCKEIAKNDGLSQKDFINWFKKPIVDGGIIHFTDLRY
jgi:hypothetical protein